MTPLDHFWGVARCRRRCHRSCCRGSRWASARWRRACQLASCTRRRRRRLAILSQVVGQARRQVVAHQLRGGRGIGVWIGRIGWASTGRHIWKGSWRRSHLKTLNLVINYHIVWSADLGGANVCMVEHVTPKKVTNLKIPCSYIFEPGLSIGYPLLLLRLTGLRNEEAERSWI